VNTEPNRRHRALRQAATDTYGNDQFVWLRQVAADCRDLPPLAAYIAIALTKYFNYREHDGWAWMAQTTLARDLGVSESTVRRALDALVKRGHLISKRRGCKETNLYRLALKEPASDQSNLHGQDRSDLTDRDQSDLHGHSGVTGQTSTSDRSNQVGVTGQTRPANPSNEPKEEPKITDTSFEERGEHPPPKSGGTRSSGRRRPQTPWPKDLVLCDDMSEHAAQKAAWTYARTVDEFDKFRNYHQSKGTVFADWNAAWRTWVTNGARYDRERVQPQGPVIDQAGNPATPPPYQHQRQPWRRRSNTDLAFGGDDE
jgi:Helix-turn-helix domain